MRIDQVSVFVFECAVHAPVIGLHPRNHRYENSSEARRGCDSQVHAYIVERRNLGMSLLTAPFFSLK